PLASAGKLGPVLFQLPPQFKADVAVLANFLAALPKARELRYTFEFRDASWFADPVYDALRTGGAALCWAESEDRDTPQIQTADFCYYRLRKPEYSKSELGAMEQGVRVHLAAGRDVYAFFKHEETPAGALLAKQVLTSIQPSALSAQPG